MHDSNEGSNGKAAKVLRSGGRWILGIVLALFVAHTAWKNSGSNEWKLMSEKDGIRVSSMKPVGYTLKKYKVEMHMDNKLSDFVFYNSNLDTGYDVGATDIQRLEEVNAPPVFYAYDNYKLDLAPFGKLDVMIVNYIHQDPQTKKITINVNAAPNKKPVNPSVMRVHHLSNIFTVTPVAAGGIDVELVTEMDLGLPYVLQNLVMPSVLNEQPAKMREMLKRDKYRNGKPAFTITELGEEPKPAEVSS